MALAGAERIFELMDEVPEVDNGYVTLVNAHIDENGTITETDALIIKISYIGSKVLWML